MKTKTALLVLALSGVAPALVADQPLTTSQPQTPSATVKIPKTDVHIAKPFAPANVEKNKIERVGNLSSRPWTQIVGWHQGVQFVSDADRNHEPQFNLFWIGNEPQ